MSLTFQIQLVIPLIVLEELNRLKRGFDERGKNARDVLRYIGTIKDGNEGDFQKGIEIKEGPTVRILLNHRKWEKRS